MYTDQQLRKITHDKQPKDRAVSVGQLTQRYAPKRDAAAASLITELRSAMAELADDLFQTHCRLALIQEGKIIIDVDDPSMVYLFRRKYLFPLREHLARTLPKIVIGDIQFRARSTE